MRRAQLRPLRDEETHFPVLARGIAHEIRNAFLPQFGNATLLSHRKLIARLLWEKGVEIIPIPAIEKIDARHRMGFAFDKKVSV
jgi:hypothetical protein